MRRGALLLLLLCPQWAQAQEDPPVSASPAPVWTQRLSLGVTAGQLGQDALYSFHLAYFPKRRLGLEATLAHNPSGGTHAALHHVGAVLPVVPSGWLRPYVVAGLGTIQVFTGTAMNAESVTKLVLHAGGGAQLHLRRDVALRLEARGLGAVDQQEDHTGFLGYAQWSVGLAFHRGLGASPALKASSLETSSLDGGEGS